GWTSMLRHTPPTTWLAFVLLGLALPAGAQTPPAPPPAEVVTLDLPRCLHQALGRQAPVATAPGMRVPAQDSQRALEPLRVPLILAPDLPTRRQQAALGVVAAAGGVDQAEREAAYAVTRTYFTVLFAREQERVTRSVVDRLSATREAAQGMLKGGAR